jgi:hypothetical protein
METNNLKKFKLIREYPGSPNLGTVITAKVDKENNNTNNFYWEGSWFNPNDFLEFWEEVVEPDYKILSFINKERDVTFTLNDDGYYQSNLEIYTLNEMLNYTVGSCGNTKKVLIHSVKRLSDGEVFTVGDTIKTHKWGSDNIINSITIADGTNSLKEGIWLNCDGGTQHFSHSIKVIQKDYEVTQVLYATEIRTLYNGEYRLYHDGVGFDLDYILNNGGRIHSVRRLSDGEKFAVGDRINIGEAHQIFMRTISMINISSDGTLVIDHEHGGLSNSKHNGIFHRIKKAPLDYEIMSYIKKGSKTCTTTKKRGGIRHDEFWDIYSVKRISDGEVFTVGDRIDFDERGEGKLLQIEFEIAPADKGTGKLCFVNDNWKLGKWFSINQLHKVKNHIFITHDGVNVYKSDTIWLLHKKTNTKSPYLIRNENDFAKLDLSDYICFSKKEKLNEYMLRHKPCLSLDDIQRAINVSPMLWDKLLAAAEAKLNYEQDTTN